MKRHFILTFLSIFLIFAVAGCGNGTETVIELSGNTPKKSGVFELKTNSAKMEFSVEGDDPVVFSAFVIPEGQTLNENITEPDAATTKAESDTVELGKEPGKYFLQVISINDWSVKITEER